VAAGGLAISFLEEENELPAVVRRMKRETTKTKKEKKLFSSLSL
jgi:hypothetical protein